MSTRTGGDAGQPAAEAGRANERVLIFVVVLLGMLILAGLAAVIARIIYLSSASPAQPARPSSAAGAGLAVAGTRLALPAGAVVKSVSLDGNRLAVHYEAPAGAGIAVVDLASGAVVHRLEVAPGGQAP